MLPTPASFSTHVKNGGTFNSLLVKPGRFAGNCNHKAIIQRWLAVVPRHQLEVRLYDRAKFHEGDVVLDFFRKSDINVSSLVLPSATNESLSLPALRLMILLNKKIPKYVSDRVNPQRANLVTFISQYFHQGPHFLPSAQCIKAFDDYYESSIQYVREEFFPDLDQELWSRHQPYGMPQSNGDIVFEDYEIELSELIASIWIQKTLTAKGSG
jgi:hypothetical protein